MPKETSRGGIDKGIERTRKQFEDSRAKFEKDVKTKKVISEAARSASVEGTDEGMKKIKELVERAGSLADKQFEKDEKDQERVIETEAKPRERDLAEKTKKTEDDVRKFQQAESGSQIDAPRPKLKEAISEGKKDASFTDERKKKQETERKKAEDTAREKGNQMKSSPVNFRRR